MMFPDSKAALPMPMAATTRTAAPHLTAGLENVERSASPSPSRLTTPSRAAMPCRTIAAKTEKTSAQTRSKA